MAPALFWVLHANKEDLIPEFYFKAGGEVLGILFVVTWIVTAIFNPDIIDDNPLYVILGYPNLCVGFDTQPATSFGVVIYVFGAYLGLRYGWTSIQRTHLIRDRLGVWQFYFCLLADWLYIISLALFSLVFVLNPFKDGVWPHTLPFFGIIVGRFVVVVASFSARKNSMSWGQRIFLGVYTFASFGFMLCVSLDFIVYENNCTPDCGDWKGPFLPWYLTAFLDYTWMVCLPLTTRFLPHLEVIHLRISAVKYEEVVNVKVQPEQIPPSVEEVQ